MNNMNTRNNKTFSGFGMQGMLMSVTVSGLVLLGAGSLGLSNARKVAAMASYPSLNRQNQEATSLIAQDIRRASSVQSANGNQIVLRVALDGGVSTVTYSYHPDDRTVTRTGNGTTQTLLTKVDSFAFSLLQRPA